MTTPASSGKEDALRRLLEDMMLIISDTAVIMRHDVSMINEKIGKWKGRNEITPHDIMDIELRLRAIAHQAESLNSVLRQFVSGASEQEKGKRHERDG